ncbi:hypothetical protein [Corynebacterium sp. ED61]|uniref:hypothetical protein n=1 Tax=Corynebacterium sp. ED61 TaxID=2211360 RepID=UPI0018841A03|nr:hypothetical protein [Corynebacterium sp. ED61]MBF0582487.1 hypothetical protein [Corynebacterium sp. ED61]
MTAVPQLSSRQARSNDSVRWVGPAGGYPPPPEHRRFPVASEALETSGTKPRVWAVSAHGGAGATALVSQVPFLGDAGQIFPSGEVDGESDLIIICAAETVTGLSAAHDLVLQHRNELAGNTELLAVVTRPAQPGWTGKRTPKVIAERLAVLGDENLPGEVIRVEWNEQLALTTPERRETVQPQDIAEWLAMDDKSQARARRVKNSPAALGILPAAADILDLAREASRASHSGA